MTKIKTKHIIYLSFLTFLFLATAETFAASPASTHADTPAETGNDASALEVPTLGQAQTSQVADNRQATQNPAQTTAKTSTHSAETYENLIEITFLALIGTGFYLLNSHKTP